MARQEVEQITPVNQPDQEKKDLFFNKKLRRIAVGVSIPVTLFVTGLFLNHASNASAETSSTTSTTVLASKDLLTPDISTSNSVQTTTTTTEAPKIVKAAAVPVFGNQESTTSTTTEQDIQTVEVDAVVYGNNIDGAGVIRATEMTPDSTSRLKVAYIGTATYPQAPFTNGLSIEDVYGGDQVSSGFYKQIRGAIINDYKSYKLNADKNGRLKYEPQEAKDVLNYFTQRPNVTYYSAELVSASDQNGESYVIIKTDDGKEIKLKTKYFVDASVEGDLARKLGASYKIGTTENVYNDVTGQKPAVPSAENNYNTAPEAPSELLTLKVYPKGKKAPLVKNQDFGSLYIHGSYNAADFAGYDPKTFAKSWSMNTAVLPDMSNKSYDKRELNEAQTDYMSPVDAQRYVLGTSADRADVRIKAISRAINFVRFLQEHGYSNIGIANVNPTLYDRGDLRIVGEETYTQQDIINNVQSQVIATGCYSLYDRHDAYLGPSNYGTANVSVPLGSIKVPGHPNLLVSSAISTTEQAYNSSVRMESTRANIGYAAGAMLELAKEKGFVSLDSLDYTNDIAPRLIQLGSDLDLK